MITKLYQGCFSRRNYNIKAFYILVLFFLMLSSACARREAVTEEGKPVSTGGDPGMVESNTPAQPVKPAYDGVLVGQIVFDSVDYIVSSEQLLQPFIKEFGDGTVVDRVAIHKVQEDKNVKPAYYLVGIGLNQGSSNLMALELDVAKDNSLYLSTKNIKYICKGSIGCPQCIFTFKGNKIVGCVCDSGSANNTCKQEVSESNQLLRGVRLKRSRDLDTF